MAPLPFSQLWPAFPPSRILFEDDDLIVIDKPIGVPTHAPDAGRFDDAFSRVKLALAERQGTDPGAIYLGIHQRLDRDTSGVLLFTKRKSANPAVAAEFEKRRVKKRYLAAVLGFRTDGPREGVLRHRLVPAPGGTMRIAHGKAEEKRGEEAITRYRVEKRAGDRCLLDLFPETGRTHQLRVQIAATGAHLGGDPLYAGAPAPRLMLHAVELSLLHPTTGRPLTVRAERPPVFDAWVANTHDDPLAGADALDAVLRAAADDRWALARGGENVAFRLANEDGDGVPGVAVDVYGEHLIVHLSSPAAETAKERILDAAYALGPRGVYLKVHPKQSNTLVDTRVEALAPAHAVRGDDAPDPLVVVEEGISLRVRLGDGLKTGLFLDQRENRRTVRALSAGKSVLNLFAYTCAFTVAAALGGAERTVSVDASPAALAWGRENLSENGVALDRHELVLADVFAWMKAARRQGHRYGLVIVDPPSFATTKKSRFSAEKDYPALAALALELLEPGGRLLACTNHRGIGHTKFRRMLHEAGRLAKRGLVQVKDLSYPKDFPCPFGKEAHLKSLLITAAS